MSVLLSTVLFLLLYLIPGIIFSRFVKGAYRNSIFLWILISYIVVPFLYMILGAFHQITLIGYSVLLIPFGVLAVFSMRVKKGFFHLDSVFRTNFELAQKRFSMWRVCWFVLLGLFFFALISPRLGLWVGTLPIGDDRPRVGQVTSVALSPNFPLHFRLPMTEMSIYYYHMVQPGLMTRFSDNLVHANQSWFIHLFVSYLLFMWLIHVITNYFARSSFEKLVMVFGMTFYSGLEYFLSLSAIKNLGLSHLEWWTDWLIPNQKLHMQISSPYTSYFWVTQHVFPALLVFVTYFVIVAPDINKWVRSVLIALLASAILGNSVFVFLAFAISYGSFFAIRLVLRKEKLVQVLLSSSIILVMSAILSVGVILILLHSGKQNYFVFHSNMFTFMPNMGIGKIMNYLLTIGLYLGVELNWLFIVYLYSLFLFFKKKLYNEPVLFLYTLTIPLFLVFVFRARGDNNFSMRATLPALTVVAIFTGWVLGDIASRVKGKLRIAFFGVTTLLFLLLTPSMIWEYQGKIFDQFSLVDPIYSMIDQNTPLRSIVFQEIPEVNGSKIIDQRLRDRYDNINHISHRFTIKPVYLFDITDTEYTSASAKETYGKYLFSDLGEVVEVAKKDPNLKDFHKYFMTSRTFNTLKRVFYSEAYNVYGIE